MTTFRTNIHHALGLHMHQPPGRLKRLINNDEFAVEQIIRCYERVTRYAREFHDIGYFHVSFSNVLLEQLGDPEIVKWCRGFGLDIAAVLESYHSATNIEILGTGHSHPIFPLIPKKDWKDQLSLGRQAITETFGRAPQGFWPPEMAFSMEMVPALVDAGYDYVIVDGDYIQPEDQNYDVFRQYRASYDGTTIAMVPLERALSSGQESGMNEKWFAEQVAQKVRQSPYPKEPRLVTTWSPGEGGGWFLQMHEESGFFGHFLARYLEDVRSGVIPIQPVLISEYIRDYQPTLEAEVRTPRWYFEASSASGSSQWTGLSESQRAVVARLHEVSDRYWELKDGSQALSGNARTALEKARKLILEAEDSCFLVRPDNRISGIDQRTQDAENFLAEVAAAVGVDGDGKEE